jgi:hypothetical protein
MDWLRSQARRAKRTAAPAAESRTGIGAEAISSESEHALPQPVEPLDAVSPAPLRRSVLAPEQQEPHAPLRLAHTDWLHHRLRITGPARDVAALQTAAAGAGIVRGSSISSGWRRICFIYWLPRLPRRRADPAAAQPQPGQRAGAGTVLTRSRYFRCPV